MVTRAQLAEFEAAAQPPLAIITVMACAITRIARGFGVDGGFIIQGLVNQGFTLAEIRAHGAAAGNEAARIMTAHGEMEDEA